VYLAAITSIDPGLYEAAVIDGAGRLRQAWHITLASIIDIILMFFILRIGTILSAGFEMIFLLYSPVVYNVADIIDTYAYREGLLRSNFGYGTAIGLFKSAVGFLLIWATNRAVRRLGGQGIW
jgi:putative aldouronate transport system permease protein